MKSKSLLILGALALVLAAAAAILVSNQGGSESAKPISKESAALFPDLRAKLNDVAKIKVKRGTVEAVLAKSPGDKPNWTVENRGNYPATFDNIRKIIGGLAETTIVEPKTAKPEFYERIGVGDVEKPGATGTRIELDDASGRAIASVIVGTSAYEAGARDPGATGGRFFVRKDGEAQSYVVKGDILVQPDPMTWLSRAIAEVDATKLKSVTVTQTPAGASAPEKITVSRSSAADQKFSIENIPAGRQPKDENAAGNLGRSMVSLAMDDVMPASGMDFSKPDAVIETRLFDGQIITAKMIMKDGKKWFAFESSFEEQAATGLPAAPTTPPAAEQPKTDAPAAPDAPKADATTPDQAKETAAKAEAAKVEAAKAEAAKAQAEEKAAAIKRVAEINEKCGPWAFVLPDYKVTQMLSKMDDLLKPLDAAPAPTAPPAPTPGSGSLLEPH